MADNLQDLGIVAIGGGTGLATLLRGIREYVDLDGEGVIDLKSLTTVVTVTDDAGATGNVTVEIVDLPGNRLGQALGDRVWIDVDAAGYGWFIDATPGGDVEFSRHTGTDKLMATWDSPAQSRVDLLATLMHEFGHVLGYEPQDGHVAVAKPLMRLREAVARRRHRNLLKI